MFEFNWDFLSIFFNSIITIMKEDDSNLNSPYKREYIMLAT